MIVVTDKLQQYKPNVEEISDHTCASQVDSSMLVSDAHICKNSMIDAMCLRSACHANMIVNKLRKVLLQLNLKPYINAPPTDYCKFEQTRTAISQHKKCNLSILQMGTMCKPRSQHSLSTSRTVNMHANELENLYNIQTRWG